MSMRLLLLALAGVVAACSTPTAVVVADRTDPSVPTVLTTGPPPTTAPPPSTATTELRRISRLAAAVTPLGQATYTPPTQHPEPTSMSIPALSVASTRVVGVGIADNGEMEIPAVSEIGWYRFGPPPGENGSAVLAGHIAYDGEPGVFRQLATLDVGDDFQITFSDGSVAYFDIVETHQYDKDELPTDQLFAKSGPPRVVLITCGGDFDGSTRSYRDNVVVIAEPRQ